MEKYKIGLIGTFFLLGMIVGVIPAGWLADKTGRKNVLAGSLIILISAAYGILLFRWLYGLYFMVFMVGISKGGTYVVG